MAPTRRFVRPGATLFALTPLSRQYRSKLSLMPCRVTLARSRCSVEMVSETTSAPGMLRGGERGVG